MIVVFVVDTSPSMGRAVEGGLSRLDLAKMLVEEITKRWKRLQGPSTLPQLGQMLVGPNHFLLLSTSRQYPDTGSCAAGGRLLVGFEPSNTRHLEKRGFVEHAAAQQQISAFARELKGLQVAKTPSESSSRPWTDDLGGAPGLNAAVSSGLQLLSRYRLLYRETENFGMGRLPSNSILLPNGAPAGAALQPACLVLVTDGACMRNPPKQGGGPLEVHFGSQPLREFYKERFRWDQRVFIIGVGSRENVNSTQYLHPSLRALCEATGGAHWSISSSSNLGTVSASLIWRVCPAVPNELPLPDPLFQQLGNLIPSAVVATGIDSNFVNSGPTVCFQSLEAEEGGAQSVARAMLFYVGSSATTVSHQGTSSLSPPLFCIPEAYFPSKKLDTLPKREAHPRLFYVHHPANLGSKTFDAMQLIKMLHRYDQMVAANKKLAGQPCKLLHRDVYVCNWIAPEGDELVEKTLRKEYFPVLVVGAGRQSLSGDGESSFFNIGVLHNPAGTTPLGFQSSTAQLATLTLLPPEPHILLPLLIHAAETEHRTLKKSAERQANKTPGRTVIYLDDQWRSEMRAYLFRIPPYYQFTLKRCLWQVLPSSAHSLLQTESIDAMKSQCFSKGCHHKILSAEQGTKENNERLELQEMSIRTGRNPGEAPLGEQVTYGHGQFDPRTTEDSYLNTLRGLPEPWRAKGSRQSEEDPSSKREEWGAQRHAVDILGEVPKSSLLAYYESRRRWLFGGSGQTIQGLHVDGVRNEGGNTQVCGKSFNDVQECPLSLAGVGASMLNQTSTARMGEYRERLLFTRSPIVGYGANDCTGVSATTGIDGSPAWSVDDDAMPASFFDPATGDFCDSVDARVRSKLMVNFGNPYKEKRADSLIPEKYLDQTPSFQRRGANDKIKSPLPGSPPHEAFESVEEGEASYVQARKSPSRTSPRRDEDESSQKQLAPPQPVPPPPPPTAPPKSKQEAKNIGSAAHPAPPKKPRATGVAKPAPPPPKAKPVARPPPPKVPKAKAPPPPPKPPIAKARPCPPKRSSSMSQLAVDTEAKEKASSNEHHSAGATKDSTPQSPKQEPAKESPDVKPDVDLPAGWVSVWSKSNEKWYFFDTKTNKSVWKWPP